MFQENQQTYRYPLPACSEDKKFGVVVEKKGEDNHHSARQREIFCYSKDIRRDGGRMVFPKSIWREFDVGEWFSFRSDNIISMGRSGKPKHKETKIFDVVKIGTNSLASFPKKDIISGGQLRIQATFVLSPKFIKHNRYAQYTKIYTLGMGLGFVSSNLASRIQPDFVYSGWFEWMGEYGGVNFYPQVTKQNEPAFDDEGHLLEPNCYWQLMAIDSVPSKKLAEHRLMSERVDDLYRRAMDWSLHHESVNHVPQVSTILTVRQRRRSESRCAARFEDPVFTDKYEFEKWPDSEVGNGKGSGSGSVAEDGKNQLDSNFEKAKEETEKTVVAAEERKEESSGSSRGEERGKGGNSKVAAVRTDHEVLQVPMPIRQLYRGSGRNRRVAYLDEETGDMSENEETLIQKVQQRRRMMTRR